MKDTERENISNAKPVIAIPEEDTVYMDDGNITVFGTGKYSVFINGAENMLLPLLIL